MAVRLIVPPPDFTFKSRERGNQSHQLGDLDFAARAEIYWVTFVVTGRRSHDPFGAVVNIKKLARGVARPPGINKC